MEQSPSRPSAIQGIPTFYGTRRFITACTSDCHLSLSWARAFQSVSPLPASWSSSLILSSHLCLSLPSGLLPLGLPVKTLYAPLLLPLYTTCPTHLIHLDLIIWMIFSEQYRIYSLSLCSPLHSPVTSSLLGPNVFLNTLFSNTLSLCSSL